MLVHQPGIKPFPPCSGSGESQPLDCQASPWLQMFYLYQLWMCFSLSHQFGSVQSLSHVQLFVTPWTAACQAFLSSPAPGACSNSCPSSWWCHPTISSSIVPFSSCPQSFPASGSFPMSEFFASGSQIWSFSFSVSLSNEYSGLISLRIDRIDLLAGQGTLKSLV